MQRLHLIHAAFLLVLAVSFAACSRGSAADTQAPSALPPPTVIVEKVETRALVEHAELTGRLGAIESVEVRPRISGHLLEVRFQSGEIVEKDQLLFSIDPRWQAAALDSRSAELAAAESRASTAERENERAKLLLDTRAISAEEAEGRAAKMLETKSVLAAARAAKVSAELDLEFTQVRSPIRGRVSRALVTAGNFVSGVAGSNTLLTTVVSLDPLYAYADLDEATFLRFEKIVRAERTDPAAEAIKIEFGLSDESGYPRTGILESLDNVLDPRTGTIVLRARVPNTDGRLVAGLFVRVRVPVSAAAPALLVDDRAVGTQQNQKYVLAIGPGNIAEYRPVTLGPVIEGKRVIRSGLAAEDTVIVTGLQRTRPGAPVTPEFATSVASAPVGQ